MDAQTLANWKQIPLKQAQALLEEVKVADKAIMKLRQLPKETRENFLKHNRAYNRAREARRKAFDLH